MHLDILIDMKLLLCSVSSPGIAFLINRKLLLCSATSPRIALAILVEQNAGFALFQSDFYILLPLMNDLHALQRTRSPGSKVFIIFERDFALVVTYVSYFRDIK